MRKIEVVAAIIYRDNKVFCTKRPNQGEVALKWEFPGGKVEIGESREQALVREIMEELNCSIEVLESFLTVNHSYKSFELTMYSFKCKLKSNKIKLTEHIDSCWLSIDELDVLDWAAADIPIVKELMNRDIK